PGARRDGRTRLPGGQRQGDDPRPAGDDPAPARLRSLPPQLPLPGAEPAPHRPDRGGGGAESAACLIAAVLGTPQICRSAISRLESAQYRGHSLAMLRKIARAIGYRVE